MKKNYVYVILPVIAIVLELLPFDFFSVVGALITIVLVAEFVLVVMNTKRG